MKWYLVKLIFHIELSGSEKSLAQFDEQLRLVHAGDRSAAYSKGYEMGMKLSSSFPNSEGNTVEWKFINVAEVILVNEIYGGVEIYSGTIETDEKQRFINSVQQRSADLVVL